MTRAEFEERIGYWEERFRRYSWLASIGVEAGGLTSDDYRRLAAVAVRQVEEYRWLARDIGLALR